MTEVDRMPPAHTLATGSAAVRSRWPRVVLAVTVMAASAVYLWRSIQSQAMPLLEMPITFGMGQWLAVLAGSVGTLLLGMGYHVLAVRRLAPSQGHARDIATAYALGQIARYIPGKAIGIWFQVNMLKGRVPAPAVLLALAVQTVYDYAWAIAFCVATLWLIAEPASLPAWIALCLALGCLWISHRVGWCERSLIWLVPRRWRPGTGVAVPVDYSAAASTTLALVWVPLLAGIAWALSGQLDARDGLRLGVCYILAAMGSLLVFVVPSGLALREALFVWMGRQAGLDPLLLVFCGVAIRIALTLAEVAIALVLGSAGLLGRRGRASQNA